MVHMTGTIIVLLCIIWNVLNVYLYYFRKTKIYLQYSKSWTLQKPNFYSNPGWDKKQTTE